MVDSKRSEHSAFSRFFRNAETGEVVVAQAPNLPLWVFIVATALRIIWHPDGVSGTVISIVGTVALVVWAALEIASGESPFRRVLGGAVLLVVLAGLLMR